MKRRLRKNRVLPDVRSVRMVSEAVIDGLNEFTTPLQLHYNFVTFWTNLGDSMRTKTEREERK